MNAVRLQLTARPRPGLRFTERMTGALTWNLGERPAATPPTLILWLTVTFDDLEASLQRPSHPGWFVGTAEARMLSDEPMSVTGRFNLLVADPARVDRRLLRYRGRIATSTGEEYRFRGDKIIAGDRGVRLWRDFTTLPITVRRGDLAGRRVGRGVLRLTWADLLRQLATVRALGADGLAEKVDTLTRFVAFFARAIRDASGGVLGTTRVIVGDATVRRPRRMPAPLREPEVFDLVVSDGARICLRRCRGGRRGPVILAPGFGVRASSFLTSTVDENLVSFLCRREYDVWLLDYRASPDFLDALGQSALATSEFTIDDIARRDWPAAVTKVLKVSGAAQVQVVAHCVGSLSFLMSVLSDGPDGSIGGRIRSAVCSQLGLHPITPTINELKAWSFLAPILGLAGCQTLNADFDEESWGHWAIDRALRVYATSDRCSNPACRRILLLFGETFKHSQLNVATHDAIQEWFGKTSVRALAHLARMIRQKRAVDADGEDVYLATLAWERDRLSFPIAFMHGAANRQFLPEGTEKTLALLREYRVPGRLTRQVFPGWGHMDCFVGQRSIRIFRWIARQLDDPEGLRTPDAGRSGSAPR